MDFIVDLVKTFFFVTFLLFMSFIIFHEEDELKGTLWMDQSGIRTIYSLPVPDTNIYLTKNRLYQTRTNEYGHFKFDKLPDDFKETKKVSLSILGPEGYIDFEYQLIYDNGDEVENLDVIVSPKVFIPDHLYKIMVNSVYNGMNEFNVRIGHICKTNKDDVVLSEICSGDYNSNNIDRYKQSKWSTQLEQW